jgi:hypothetical protein
MEIAYIAGFFDGEGHCGLASGTVKRLHHNRSYQPNVKIVNTNQQVLLDISKTIGLGYLDSGKQQKEHWKRSYALWFPQDHIVKFLRMVLPHLRLKLRQAELLIEFCETLKAESKQLTEEQITRRREIYNELAALNQRGS